MWFPTVYLRPTATGEHWEMWSTSSTLTCDRDRQCGGGMCCAVTLWLRSLRICTPMGNEGDECHPLSHKVPYIGKRMHHTCPCLPNLTCVRFEDGYYRCLPQFKIENVFF
ncbi:prokineticin-2 isoform X1 [Stegostoma tigrinum]|uniref:prokineticin-2 isoform X1 n=1 Tax=Stegostoma tigrinum TaxID=3053191 RepID=UPI00202B0E71|nr:prokineticin-2 isoform X1 [Stegostoma tigrinum]